MAQQVPRPVPLQDDDDAGDISCSPGRKSPLTLSFINNVQSAVAQIEDRLASGPSAHPPPPSRHELPQTPPGPNDSVIERVQFLESSLSISPPKGSTHASLAASAFGEAVNSDGSMLSSGVIISTTPPNSSTTKVSTPINNNPTSQADDQVPSAPLLEAIDSEVKGPATSIAPIVEHFETPGAPVFTKEHHSGIITAPIAPIVEQFEVPSSGTDHAPRDSETNAASGSIAPIVDHVEVSGQPVKGTSSTITTATIDVRLIKPVAERSEASTVGACEVSSTTSSSDPNPEAKASILEPHDASLDAISKSVRELGVPTGSEVAAGVPTVRKLEDPNATDEAALQTLSSTHEDTQTMSSTAQQFTPVPVVDGWEHLTHDLGKGRDADGVFAETDMVKSEATLMVAPWIDNSNPADVDTSLDRDQNNSQIPRVGDEETDNSHETTETPGRTEKQSEADVGNTSLEAADVDDSSVRMDEAHEGPASLDDGNTVPSEHDNSAVEKTTTAKVDGTAPSQTGGAGEASFEGLAHDTTVPKSAGAVSRILASNLEGGLLDVGQSSGSSPFTDNGFRAGVGSSSLGPASSDASQELQPPSAVAEAHLRTSRETPAEVRTEAEKFEEQVPHESGVTPGQGSQLVSRENNTVEDTEDRLAENASENTTSSMDREPCTGASQEEHEQTADPESREDIAAKAIFARDKLAKFSLASPVTRPHRAPVVRKTNTHVSSLKASRSVPVTPTIRRSHTGFNSRKSSHSRTSPKTKSTTPKISAILDATADSPKQRKLRSLSVSPRKSDIVSMGLPPRQSPTQAGKIPSHRTGSPPGYTKKEDRQEGKALQSEPQQPLQLSQPSSGSVPRLPRVAGLSSARSGSSTTPQSASITRTRANLPRASTFSTTVQKSTSVPSSTVSGRKVGISSSPVTPSSVEKPSSTPRAPLQRTLSFTRPKLSDTPLSSLPHSTSPRTKSPRSRGDHGMTGLSGFRGSDMRSTMSLSGSGSKPPRGGRPRFTVPEPFALTGPELHERSVKQIEESRRRAEEAAARPRVFKPRPMPDFSKPCPKPHNGK